MIKTNILRNQTILITGGTGSFGGKLLERILTGIDSSDYPNKIIIFSRDEKKQHDLRVKYKDYDFINYIIGDTRDHDSVLKALKKVDYVFHAAALKQVPACEFFPMEAIKTNVIGSFNVLEAAEANEVKKVVVLSTDKAVYPINTMGMTKALMEKLTLANASRSNPGTCFCGVRYGNVMYSRGSVIPLFIEQIKRNLPLTITNPDMTRYLLPLDVAIDLVLFALENAQSGDILVRKAPASTVDTIAEAVIDIFNYKKEKKIIGIREGEKMHETLVTKEELIKSEEYDKYFRIKTLTKIDYDKYYVEGSKDVFPTEDYTSENTRRLDFEQTKKLIMSLPEIKKIFSTAEQEYTYGTNLGWKGED